MNIEGRVVALEARVQKIEDGAVTDDDVDEWIDDAKDSMRTYVDEKVEELDVRLKEFVAEEDVDDKIEGLRIDLQAELDEKGHALERKIEDSKAKLRSELDKKDEQLGDAIDDLEYVLKHRIEELEAEMKDMREFVQEMRNTKRIKLEVQK